MTGDAVVGATLTATPNPSNATSVTYQWQANTGDGEVFVDIDGATGKTFVIPEILLGQKIQVVAKGYNNSTATSNAVGPIGVLEEVTTQDELVEALADEDVSIIKLGADITLDSYLNVTRDVTIDGNDFSMTREVSEATDNESYVVMVYSGKLTAKNIGLVSNNTQTNPEANAVGITVQAGASLDLSDSTITASSENRSAYGVYLQDGSVAASITNTVFDLTAEPDDRSEIAIGLETTATEGNPFDMLTKSGNTIPEGAYELAFYVPAGFAGDPVAMMEAALADGQRGYYWGDKLVETVTTQDELVEALADEDVSIIKLGENVVLNETVNINSGRTITLDLNGNTVSATLATAFNLTKGTLNVVDTAATKGGISVSGEAFRVNGSGNTDANQAVLDIGAGVNVTSSADCAVFIYSKATLNTAGNLTSKGVFATIQGNGNASSNGTLINITGGKVVATLSGYHAIYVPQDGVMNITGGEISSAGTAIEAKGGTLTISGGTISTSATSTSHVPNGNGGSAVGYALAVIDNAGYAGAQVTVSGGTFDGPVALLDDDSDATNNHSSLIINAISAMPTSIQSILDQAGDGTTINLTAGDYGTIYLRQSESKSQSIDVSTWAGDADVERYREFKDISIIGTTGAKVDQIAVEAQLYIPNSGHSNDNGVNHLSSYISISNLTIKDIEFTGNKPVAVNLQSIWSHSSVNGLTIDGCTLTGQDADKTAKTSFLLRADGDTSAEINDDKGTGELIMTTGRSNLTVKNCTVGNVWIPINITEWKGIIISDNNFSNSGRNDILVTGPSADPVRITGNTLDAAGERSIRLNQITGGAEIKNNIITNCVGDPTDTPTSLMKFSAGGEGSTVYLSGNKWNGATDEQAKNDGSLIIESPTYIIVE